MAIVKASKARNKTEAGKALQVELEREKQRRLVELEQEKQRFLITQANEKQKLGNKAKIRNAQVARQRNQLHKKILRAAGEGYFLVPINELELELSEEFKELGVRVSSVSEDQKVIRSGLFMHWGLDKLNLTNTDYSGILEPLRRFIMISIINAWRSRENDVRQIRTLSTIVLADYYDDLKRKDYHRLWNKIDRLFQLDSDDRHAEVLISDLMFNRSDFIKAKNSVGSAVMDIPIDVDAEAEFFKIVGSIRVTLKAEEFSEEIEQELKDQAGIVADSVINSLSVLPHKSVSLSWWSSYYHSTTEPENFSEELFWLASDAGQNYLAAIAEKIEFFADAGESRVDVLLGKSTDEYQIRATIQKYLESQGYDVSFEDGSDKEVTLCIKWT